MARRFRGESYDDVHVEAPFSARLDEVLRTGAPIGLHKGDRFGIFPLGRLGPSGDGTEEWVLWASRADQAAQQAGFPNLTAGGLTAVGGLRPILS